MVTPLIPLGPLAYGGTVLAPKSCCGVGGCAVDDAVARLPD
jgi:hypothetical protein